MAGGSDDWRYDVAIAGGGAAGGVCALRIARAGRRVLLVDGWRRAVPAVPEVLSPEGVHALRALGAGDVVEAAGAARCRGVLSRWSSDEPEFIDYSGLRLAPGYVVDRAEFDARLRAHARAAGAEVVEGATLHGALPEGGEPARLIVRPSDGPAWSAAVSCVVEAGGRVGGCVGGPLAQRLYFDRLVAIPMPLREPDAAADYLSLAPSPTGWWYAAPAGSPAPAVVYLTDGDLAPRTIGALDRLATAELEEALGVPRRAVDLPASLRFRDARTSCRRWLCRPGWLCVGDALFTLDPLSGNGLARGLRMGDAAVDAVLGHLESGELAPLAEYARTFAEEFNAQRQAGLAHYAAAAARFPESSFWRRRVALVAAQ